MIRRFMVAALAASLTLVAGFAQIPAELLQKGIYTQETAGDLDGAIQIYRQVVGLASTQPAIAAQAQFRLTQSLLQKGDLAGAGPEFEILARNYSGQQDLVDDMGQRLRTIAANGPAQVLGSFQNGRYHHYWTGIELTEPPGWTFKGQRANPDGWDRVDLVDAGGKAAYAFVVMTREPEPNAELPWQVESTGLSVAAWTVVRTGGGGTGLVRTPLLNQQASSQASVADRNQQRLKAKLTQRADGDVYHGYAYREGTVQTRMLGGQEALSVIGDYKDAHGAPMSEYLTWVGGPKSRVCFSVAAPAAVFADLMARFEPIITSAAIP